MNPNAGQYVSARHKAKLARNSLFAMLAPIGEICETIKSNPEDAFFVNISSATLDDVIARNPESGIDGNRWPAATAIQESLSQFQSAQSLVRKLWEDMTDQERHILDQPDKFD